MNGNGRLDWRARVRLRLLGIARREVEASRRGFFQGDPEASKRLTLVGRSFLAGYHSALSFLEAEALVQQLQRVPGEFRGFAFEGAAMAWRLLDYFTPWRARRRLKVLSRGIGRSHIYMIHVGAGWTLARVPWAREGDLNDLDPLLKWLAVDGYGFHQGYFRGRRFVEGKKRPRHLSSYGRRAFDQGLGRSLWFVEGADIGRVAWRASLFPPQRRSDLWSGVGLAVAYAGGASREGLECLKKLACGYRWDLAQGAAFAAAARSRAGNCSPHTDLACHALCGLEAEQAARLTRDASRCLASGEAPRYEVWRLKMRAMLARRKLEETAP